MPDSNQMWQDRADKESERFAKHPWGWFMIRAIGVIAVIVALTVIVSLITTGGAFFNAEKARIVNPALVKQKIYKPSNTLAQISFFHNTCNDVHAQYVQWQNNEATYQADLTASNNPRLSTIQQQQAIASLTTDQQNAVGAANQLENTAQTYNARSRTYSANVFKGHGLPDQINPPAISGLSKWTPPGCGE